MKTKAQLPEWTWKAVGGCAVVLAAAIAWSFEKRPAAGPELQRLDSLTVQNAAEGAVLLAGSDDVLTASDSHPFAGPPDRPAAQDESVEVLQGRLAIASGPAEKGALAEALIRAGSEDALRAWGRAVLAESEPANLRAMMAALDNLNGQVGLEIVTQLVELSDRPEVFDGLARTLSRMANGETPQHLAELSSQPEAVAGQHERALRLLAGIANAEAVPGLAGLLYQPALGTDVSGHASISLGKIGNPASVIALAAAFSALPEERFAARQQVLQALASVSNPESAALLSDLAANSDQPLIASAAKDALKQIPVGKESASAEARTWLPSAEYLTGKSAASAR